MWRRVSFVAVFSFSCLLIHPTMIFGQDVGEAARQERARKDAQNKNKKHVYTEDDLTKAHILTDDDKARYEAKRKKPTGLEQSNEPLDAGLNPTPIPLGDIARKLRKQKQETEAARRAMEQAMHAPEFHLPFAKPALAAPARPLSVQPPHPVEKRNLPIVKSSPFTPKFSSPEFNAQPPVVQKPAAPVAPVAPNPAVTSHPLGDPDPSAEPRPPVASNLPVGPKSSEAAHAPANPIATTVPPKKLAASSPSIACATVRSSIVKVAPRTEPTVSKTLKPVAPPSVNSGMWHVVVQPGDSLWKLAERNWGTGTRWHELLSVNPSISNPDHIRVGDEIYLPSKAATTSQASSPSEDRGTEMQQSNRYQIREGDTLSGVAQQFLGNAHYWSCIAHSNPDISDPNLIYAGRNLLIPAGCPAP